MKYLVFWEEKLAFRINLDYENNSTSLPKFAQFRKSLPLNDQIQTATQGHIQKTPQAKTLSSNNLKNIAPKLESTSGKLNILKNMGEFKKETLVMLKSNIL
jgi:hypothetical protein